MRKNSKHENQNEARESEHERNAASLRAEIEDTRERFSADVDALGAKISPQNMKAEAKQAIKNTVQRGATQVRDGVSSAGSNLLSVVKENPVPLALIGAGLGLLVWSLRDVKKRSVQPDYAATGPSGVYDPSEHPSGEGEGADGRLRQLGERARQGVDSVKRAASDTLEQAQEQLGKATDAARDGARRARKTAVHKMDESPCSLARSRWAPAWRWA